MNLDTSNAATFMVGIVLAIVAGIGGVITIVEPSTLSFKDYVDALEKLIVGVGILGVGRGLAAAGRASAAPGRSSAAPGVAERGT
jgi:hypothetical protein